MDEMKRWAHILADMNEREFDLKKTVREGELRLSDLIQELGWAKEHLAPWVKRRLTGTSSGDSLSAKYPDYIRLTAGAS